MWMRHLWYKMHGETVKFTRYYFQILMYRNFLDILSEYTQISIFMKILPLVAEFFSTGGQTDMTKPVFAFLDCANAPKITNTQFCHSIVTCFCLWLYHPVVRTISSAPSIICLYSIYLSRVCVSWQASKGYSNQPVHWKPSPSRRVRERERESTPGLWKQSSCHQRAQVTVAITDCCTLGAGNTSVREQRSPNHCVVWTVRWMQLCSEARW